MTEIKRISKYAIVGISGTIIDVLCLFILVHFFYFNIIVGASISFIFAATNNFFWNKKWTFENKNRSVHHQYIKFLIISIVGLFITVIFMYFFSVLIGIWYILAKLMTSVIVLFWNYLGNKKWTFKVADKIPDDVQNYKFEYSIIVPAYNEADRITSTLCSIKKYCVANSKSAEIIIVDDGSTDSTSQVIKDFSEKENFQIRVIVLEKNMGKGFAIKTGIKNSSGKYVLFTDADNSTPIEELDNLSQYILENDVVIGSRKIIGSVIDKKQLTSRKMISSIGSIISSLLINDIRDTQCGFKLIKGNIARFIFDRQKIHRFGFDLELLAIAQHYELKILEVPVKWSDNSNSKLRPFRDTLITLKEFLYIQYNFLRKRY